MNRSSCAHRQKLHHHHENITTNAHPCWPSRLIGVRTASLFHRRHQHTNVCQLVLTHLNVLTAAGAAEAAAGAAGAAGAAAGAAPALTAGPAPGSWAVQSDEVE